MKEPNRSLPVTAGADVSSALEHVRFAGLVRLDSSNMSHTTKSLCACVLPTKDTERSKLPGDEPTVTHEEQ